MCWNKSLVIVVLVVFVFLGGRAFAECPSADISGNCFVDLEDFATLSAAWLSDDSGSLNWNPACDISDPSDGVINELDLDVLISEWLDEGAFDLVWVTINDPGVSGHEGFNGEMSKYETTNAQYCEFLNAALASGDITVVSNVVKGAIGSNSGEDFEDKIYFATYEASTSSQITYSGETFSVRSRDGHDMSNHPVVIVSWYGATAFCNYYGYRLPTEWEWQAVADYDGTFNYGCGLTIDQTKANYHDNDSGYANPLGLTSSPYTSPVNHYSTYGYGMNDMAGNVCEWTSSVSGSDCVIRGGGSWFRPAIECFVSSTLNRNPQSPNSDLGFRACR